MDNSKLVSKAVNILKSGGVIIFPTDTVWGVGVSVKRLDAIGKLYEIKGRPKNKPTAVLVGNIAQAAEIGFLHKKAKDLIDRFWPGGLTLVVKAKSTVPEIIKGAGDTVGIRMPDHELVLTILNQLGCGIVTASANFAGQPPAAEKEMLDQRLIDRCDFLVKGSSNGGLPSTVLDVTAEPFKIIRQGMVKISA